jgi:hypothetical protein
VLIGDGAGTLRRVSPAISTGVFTPGAVAAGDFNDDGALDVATADTQASKFAVLVGDGAGHLQMVETPVSTGGTGLAGGLREVLRVGDFNGDGRPDAVIANVNDGTVAVLLNQFAYARPRGATPVYASLVPAYEPCTTGNRAHGAPLSFPSCASPQQASGQLTVGTGDANGHGAKSIGSVALNALAADVRIATSITDVRTRSDLSAYTGSVQTALTLRLTERVSTPGGDEPQTTQDFPFRVPVSCAATADATVGSTCSLTTTANTIMPGAVAGSKRSIWALDRIQVYDAGPDGDVSTAGDNALFETQGLFVP